MYHVFSFSAFFDLCPCLFFPNYVCGKSATQMQEVGQDTQVAGWWLGATRQLAPVITPDPVNLCRHDIGWRAIRIFLLSPLQSFTLFA
jgi:hypothetical protein